MQRDEERSPVRLTAVISGFDKAGLPFSQTAEIRDISRLGARARGLSAELAVGSILQVQRAGRSALYEVLWIGTSSTPTEGDVGLRCVGLRSRKSVPILAIGRGDSRVARCTELLTHSGYSVTSSPDLLDGWKQLQSHRYEALLLDPLLDDDCTEFLLASRIVTPFMRIMLFSSAHISEKTASLADFSAGDESGTNDVVAAVDHWCGRNDPLKWPIERTADRYLYSAPVCFKIFRNGVLCEVNGVTTDISKTGVAADLSNATLIPGEFGTLRIQFPAPWNTTTGYAVARRRRGASHGIEFVEPSKELVETIDTVCKSLKPFVVPHLA
jgi:hypothetical protein